MSITHASNAGRRGLELARGKPQARKKDQDIKLLLRLDHGLRVFEKIDHKCDGGLHGHQCFGQATTSVRRVYQIGGDRLILDPGSGSLQFGGVDNRRCLLLPVESAPNPLREPRHRVRYGLLQRACGVADLGAGPGGVHLHFQRQQLEAAPGETR